MLINSFFQPNHHAVTGTKVDNTSTQKSSTSSQSLTLDSNSQKPSQDTPGKDLNAQFIEQREIQKLKNIDQEVRAHERAHLSAAGRYATSGASFSYQRGPDGHLYAVAGEVGIDISKVPGNPEQTLLKAQTIMRAALAPANPSSQDQRVAAQATALAQQAKIEIAVQQQTEAPDDIGQYLDAFV